MNKVTVAVDRIVHQEAWGIIVRGPDAGIGSEPEGPPVTIRMTRRSYLMPPVAGEVWAADGRWERTRYGPQLVAETAVRVQPSGRWIIPFFQARIDGIGPERARRLREYFTDSLPEVLDSDGADAVAVLAPVLAPRHPGLGTCLAEAMIDAWRSVRAEARTLAWLDELGITDRRICNRLLSLFKDRVRPTLEANPYLLVPLLQRWEAVDNVGLRILSAAPEVAHPQDDKRRLLGSVDSAVKEAVSRGHTAVQEQALRQAIARRLGADGTTVDRALEIGKVNCGILSNPEGLWRAPGCAFLEDRIAVRFRDMMAEGWRSALPRPTLDCIIDQIAGYERVEGEARRDFRLNPEQKLAVHQTATRQLSVLTGGAGTGKSSCVAAICHVWTALGGNVILTALAGKAVLNLASKTGGLYPARTIVRLLKELRHNAVETKDVELNNRSLLVVDEASMVDIGQWHGLLEMMPGGAHLLAVGDPHQLPPIGPGLVFDRLAQLETVTIRLETVHRQEEASGIPAVASSIRNRILPPLPCLRPDHDGVYLVEALDGDLGGMVVDVVDRLGGFPSGQSRLQIIAPTNERHSACVEALNEVFHRRRVDAVTRIGGQPVVLRGAYGRTFTEGDPVIYLRNDYARGLCNGTQGRIIEVIEKDGALRVDFYGEQYVLSEDDTVDLALAYAITCHKAQGSSAEIVVIPVYACGVLDRAWLYTAVTRAERLAVLVGCRAMMEAVLTRATAAERRVVGFDLQMPYPRAVP